MSGAYHHWRDTPTRVLAGRHDRMFPLDFQRRIARARLGLEVDEIDGGHMVAMSHPSELADRLEAFRREVQSERGRESSQSTLGEATAPEAIRPAQ